MIKTSTNLIKNCNELHDAALALVNLPLSPVQEAWEYFFGKESNIINSTIRVVYDIYILTSGTDEISSWF